MPQQGDSFTGNDNAQEREQALLDASRPEPGEYRQQRRAVRVRTEQLVASNTLPGLEIELQAHRRPGDQLNHENQQWTYRGEFEGRAILHQPGSADNMATELRRIAGDRPDPREYRTLFNVGEEQFFVSRDAQVWRLVHRAGESRMMRAADVRLVSSERLG